MKNSLKASCHCGAVTIEIDRKPDFINDCNCSFCRKCAGVWGYFSTKQCRVIGETRRYCRTDYLNPAVQIHFCETCSATTHWTLTDIYLAKNDGADQMGVNMHLFIDADLPGIELRFPDGKNWFGEKPFGYRKAPYILSLDTPL